MYEISILPDYQNKKVIAQTNLSELYLIDKVKIINSWLRLSFKAFSLFLIILAQLYPYNN